MTEQPKNVHQAWLDVMRDVGAIGKDEKANAGTYSYQFRGVERTVNAVQPVLLRHGVTVVPIAMRADTYEYQTNKGKREEMARVTTRWLVTGPDGSHFEMESIGSASDGGDKAVVQAASVAQRIGLLQGLQIPTTSADDDPDHHHPERSAADEEAAKAGGWQDAAQRDAVWNATLAMAQALPRGAHDAVVLPWAKKVGLSPDTLTVALSEEWKAKIAEAQNPPSDPIPAPPTFDAEEAFTDLTARMRLLGSKDCQAIQDWLDAEGIITPAELTKDRAAEWFAKLSDVLGAAASASLDAPKEWKSDAERKRTFESLLERQGRLPEIVAADVIDWGRGVGLSEDLTADLAEEWLAKIIEAEFAAEAPFD